MITNLEQNCNELLLKLNAHPSKTQSTLKDIQTCIDLTCLKEPTTPDEIRMLTIEAERYQMAAVCVFPQALTNVPLNNTVQRATVVNFPGGNVSQADVLSDIEKAIMLYLADEIDYVFPYQAYLSGQQAFALTCCEEAYQHCKQQGRIFKVILETGALPSLEIMYKLSIEVIERGCDFLKTSTGKINIGATLPAAFTLLSAIKSMGGGCGIKLSGGIRSFEQANRYVSLAEHILDRQIDKQWFRFGCSKVI